jgi:hypothetical protein
MVLYLLLSPSIRGPSILGEDNLVYMVTTLVFCVGVNRHIPNNHNLFGLSEGEKWILPTQWMPRSHV